MSSRNESHPSRSLVTWGLAFVLLCLIDAGITRTDVLWGPTAFENSGGLRLVFPQTYQVARKIYAPERDADVRVALLGNSRVVLAIRERRLERALARIGPERDTLVSNLGIFGSFMGGSVQVLHETSQINHRQQSNTERSKSTKKISLYDFRWRL